MTLKGHKNHYNVKLFRGYGVAINLKDQQVILKDGMNDITGKSEKEDGIVVAKNKNDFCWVEVKTSSVELSKNQIRTLKKITIPLYRFRVPNPLLDAKKVYIYWDKVNSEYLANRCLDEKGNRFGKRNPNKLQD